MGRLAKQKMAEKRAATQTSALPTTKHGRASAAKSCPQTTATASTKGPWLWQGRTTTEIAAAIHDSYAAMLRTRLCLEYDDFLSPDLKKEVPLDSEISSALNWPEFLEGVRTEGAQLMDWEVSYIPFTTQARLARPSSPLTDSLNLASGTMKSGTMSTDSIFDEIQKYVERKRDSFGRWSMRWMMQNGRWSHMAEQLVRDENAILLVFAGNQQDASAFLRARNELAGCYFKMLCQMGTDLMPKVHFQLTTQARMLEEAWQEKYTGISPAYQQTRELTFDVSAH
ncbi:hypothetical protein BJ508DRAFT_410529 [Ascobolus immersus RN42]|uniref:Uncharacterized protein n=1 Tax=Ascobolus immersus RN42 TaxID=1160509 RepID=A0A3N4IPI5_ASCIM|nr:hypothetical protein BJ508DRAFT_410529 [Ascobolus immersus RN42]